MVSVVFVNLQQAWVQANRVRSICRVSIQHSYAAKTFQQIYGFYTRTEANGRSPPGQRIDSQIPKSLTCQDDSGEKKDCGLIPVWILTLYIK